MTTVVPRIAPAARPVGRCVATPLVPRVGSGTGDVLPLLAAMSTWWPRQGTFVALALHRFESAHDEEPDRLALRVVAAEVARGLRSEDVVGVMSPATVAVLTAGIRDATSATALAVRVRAVLDDHPLLPVGSCRVAATGMAMAGRGFDPAGLLGHAQDALREAYADGPQSLSLRLLVARPDSTVSVARISV